MSNVLANGLLMLLLAGLPVVAMWTWLPLLGPVLRQSPATIADLLSKALLLCVALLLLAVGIQLSGTGLRGSDFAGSLLQQSLTIIALAAGTYNAWRATTGWRLLARSSRWYDQSRDRQTQMDDGVDVDPGALGQANISGLLACLLTGVWLLGGWGIIVYNRAGDLPTLDVLRLVLAALFLSAAAAGLLTLPISRRAGAQKSVVESVLLVTLLASVLAVYDIINPAASTATTQPWLYSTWVRALALGLCVAVAVVGVLLWKQPDGTLKPRGTRPQPEHNPPPERTQPTARGMKSADVLAVGASAVAMGTAALCTARAMAW